MVMFLACDISSATFCALRHHACARISGAVNTEAIRAERACVYGGLQLLMQEAFSY